ncbi:MAG TPA: AlpA family transcriptional regulator [Noviherbaspirillum sp.]|uniref:helix-turn-helix transcriptional regulator n=1 Tax=Noviherbaspirillum sp. TaxID=1926288 RepID=UPI002B4778D0|nr:AlpA family transcriptional regulator [Noviherbaspirillum sp.]HJV88382.1 AlpA family transcriptional regulator [Noviherbaspirillum sp.]
MFDPKNSAFLKMRAVIDRTGKSRSTIYSEIKKGLFPSPIQTGPRSVAWLSDDIDEWIASCVRSTRMPESTKE